MLSLSSASSYVDSNRSVDLTSYRTVVAGGTQGIGAGIALRFALAGSDVWLVGRSQERANAVLENLSQASKEASRRNGTQLQSDHRFFSADLSQKSEIVRVSEEIARSAGSEGIDFLFATQGGPPTGILQPPSTPNDKESHFTVQVLSRFGIANILASSGVVKRGICFVAAPSGGKFDVDDLDFSQAQAAGKFKNGFWNIPRMGQRDSGVLDCVSTTLAERYPTLQISHLFPSLVSTDGASNAGFPEPLPWLFKHVGGWIATTPGPGGYAELPFYLHAHPEGNRYLRVGQPNLLGAKLQRYDPSPATDKTTRERVWSTLESWLK